MGGMAAFIPSRRDETVNKMAFEKIRQDKEREVADGFDGTWVAHPDLVAFAKDIFMKARCINFTYDLNTYLFQSLLVYMNLLTKVEKSKRTHRFSVTPSFMPKRLSGRSFQTERSV